MTHSYWFSTVVGCAALLVLFSSDKAEAHSGLSLSTVGSGTSAFSLANNFVGLANDLNAAYANPAGLSFVKSREFQAGVEGLANHVATSFDGEHNLGDLRRFRISTAGLLYPLPTSRGGLAIAGLVHSPTIYDDILVVNQTDSTGSPGLSDYRMYGNQRYWTGAFGLQVAPGLAIGGAVSLVTSTDNTRDIYTSAVPGSSFDYHYTRTAIGYDLRLGIMYQLMDQFRIGARIEFPQRYRYEEIVEGYQGTRQGNMWTSYRGALGFSAQFPWLTVTTEGHVRMPYGLAYPSVSIPNGSAAAHYKVGVGAGLALPLASSGFSLKAGYSWDEYDPFALVAALSSSPRGERNPTQGVTWDSPSTIATDLEAKNLISMGMSYLAGKMLLDVAYGYQFWSMTTIDRSLDTKLTEEHGFHRVALSLSIRY